MSRTQPMGDEGLHLAVEKLRDTITDAVGHLADLDAEADLEEFGRMLDRLVETSAELLAQADAADAGLHWRQALDAALAHLREARDLLDDGEPSDAVALEVMAAGDVLQRRLAD
ncbi:MAG: hypothetical protein WAT58_11195 [Candidatus Dormiibacterota bacterium]